MVQIHQTPYNCPANLLSIPKYTGCVRRKELPSKTPDVQHLEGARTDVPGCIIRLCSTLVSLSPSAQRDCRTTPFGGEGAWGDDTATCGKYRATSSRSTQQPATSSRSSQQTVTGCVHSGQRCTNCQQCRALPFHDFNTDRSRRCFFINKYRDI